MHKFYLFNRRRWFLSVLSSANNLRYVPKKSINNKTVLHIVALSRNRKNFNEAIPLYDYICKFSQIVIQRLDLNPKEEVMALFLSAGTGYAANYQSEINDRVFRKECISRTIIIRLIPLLSVKTIIFACATWNWLPAKWI